METSPILLLIDERGTLLAEFDILIRQHLIKQKLLHADETGINIGGKSLWLHTLCNDKFTLFFPHTDRGGEAMKDMGVLERFCGILLTVSNHES